MGRRSKRSLAARRGWITRRTNEALRDKELRAIENLLGEDFETLAEARKSLQEQSEPVEEASRTITIEINLPRRDGKKSYPKGTVDYETTQEPKKKRSKKRSKKPRRERKVANRSKRKA